MRFALALHTDDGITYGVTVPDLPGCFSAGKNLDHAIEMAAEAIDLHVEGLIDAGEVLPSPKSLTEHNADPLLSDAIWAFVEVPVEKYFGKTREICIALPERVLERIDQYVHVHGET